MVKNFARRPEQSFEELIRNRIQNRMSPSGLVVTNKDGPKATIRIYDEIGWFGVTADEVAEELGQITADEIEVQISSLGGDVFDGIAIYNALRAHPAKITTRVDSMAASIASVIAQAGDHRVMLTGSQMMIHEAWGLAIGNSSVMRDLGDILDKQSGIIAGIYAEASGGDSDGFFDLMRDETWMDHDETVAAGLADEVIKPAKNAAPSPNGTLSQHLAATAKAVNEVTERVAEVITLRSDEGKSTDDAWQTRPEVDQLSASLDRLVAALSPSDDEASEGHVVPEDDAQTRLDALRERAEARQEALTAAADRLKGLT